MKLADPIARLRTKALSSPCNYRVAALGLDRRGRPLAIRTNRPRFTSRQDWHAEERVLYDAPPNLATILLGRVGATGDWLPIDPCDRCLRLAARRGVRIVSVC